MAARRIFLLASGQLTVYPYEGGRLRDPLVFVSDETGLTQFASYLEQTPSDPVYLVVDFVEEEFREETIPHVFGGDRRALMRTKSNRLFRDARYTHAIIQGRESGGRRDDRVLFSALIRPDLLAPWVGQIARHKVPLAGVYSLALLAPYLLKRLSADTGSVLLVSLQSSGGLRQTFLQNGQVKLSRLAVMPYLESGQFASYILAEVEKIRRYLNSLRLVSRDSPLEVYVLSHGEMRADLERQASDSVSTNHHFVDVAELGAKLGLKRHDGTAYADRLVAQLVARTTPANHYASSEETRYHSMFRARTFLKVASVLLILGSLGYSGLKFVEGAIASEQTEAIAAQTRFYDQRYEVARAELPKAPAEARELALVVRTAEILDQRRLSPVDVMSVVSRAMSTFPSVQIDGIDWKRSDNPNAPVGGRGPYPAGAQGRLGRSGEGFVGDPGVVYELALVSGRIAPFEGDYRAAIRTINGFTDALTALPSVEHARVMSLPLELSSTETLRGGTDAAVGPAAFEVRLALRVEVPSSVSER